MSEQESRAPQSDGNSTPKQDIEQSAQDPRVECCPFSKEPYYLPGQPDPGNEFYCPRCGDTITGIEDVEYNNAVSHKFALLGSLLLPFALFLPMLTIEQINQRNQAGLVTGVITLWQHGDVILALVIGILSGLFPTFKLTGMVLLTSNWFTHLKHKRWVYRLVEFTGSWGMADVFLGAISIFAFKFSELFSIVGEIGLVAFTAVVVCNFISTKKFDPRIYRRHFHAA